MYYSHVCVLTPPVSSRALFYVHVHAEKKKLHGLDRHEDHIIRLTCCITTPREPVTSWWFKYVCISPQISRIQCSFFDASGVLRPQPPRLFVCVLVPPSPWFLSAINSLLFASLVSAVSGGVRMLVFCFCLCFT